MITNVTRKSLLTGKMLTNVSIVRVLGLKFDKKCFKNTFYDAQFSENTLLAFSYLKNIKEMH